MAQPIWNTAAGSIGSYIENKSIAFQFVVTPSVSSNTLKYKLLNGSLPKTITLSELGFLSGTVPELGLSYTNTFTIRVFEYSLNTLVGFKDRTFSLSVSGESVPKFTISDSNLGSYDDSIWLLIPLSYENPLQNNVTVELVDGNLPPGLELDSSGVIVGYASPPVNLNNAPITKTFTFVLKISNDSQFSTTEFSITIINQEINSGFAGRRPVIFNINQPTKTILKTDEYDSYYLYSSDLGTFNQSTKFKFKIIGYDFDGDNIQYSATGLSGVGTLTCDQATGWISGTLPTIGNNLNTVNISVVVNKGSLSSNPLNLTFKIQGAINSEVTWKTESNLGNISNTTISTLAIVANSTHGLSLNYSLISGSLPSGLVLLSDGTISGRVAFESISEIQTLNNKQTYTFTIKASSPTYSFVASEKTFTLTTNQTYTEPYDNIYMQAFIREDEKQLYSNFINNTNIFPNDYIYRPADPYFGKSKKIIYQHLFGVPSNISSEYIEAITKNHYKRDIIMSKIKTAVAKNSDGIIVYEVVYSEIFDDLINNEMKSVSKEFLWPQQINSLPEVVYPASLYNMREQIITELGSNNKSEILPLWMRSIQSDGSTIGFIPVFVICYTKPGYSNIIKNNINTKWSHKLNEIQFTIDRLIVDKSFTYQFDSSTGVWTALPSSISNANNKNMSVLFKNNILEND